jgi:replicative DNA helicase
MTFSDETAEKELIGNLLNDADCAVEVMGYLSAEDFTDAGLAAAYSAFCEAYANAELVDLRMIAERSKVAPSVLAECMDLGFMSANIKWRAGKVVEHSHRRRTLFECRRLAGELAELSGADISGRLSEMAANITLKSSEKKVYGADDLVRRVIEAQDTRRKGKGAIDGILTGYPVTDQQIRGMKPKRVTVIAAGTGFGKTSLALNLFNNAVREHVPSLYVSNENDIDDNLDRLCAMTARADMKQVESGAAYEVISSTFAHRYKGKTAFISDNSPRNIDEVCATVSKYAIQHNIKLAVVDYIGEISGEGKARESEEAMYARYSQRLVDCAKTLGVHIIILAQLNREGNKKGKPSKAELALCFRLAQKAHTMLLFWQDEGDQDVITIEKNRQGPAKIDIAVTFDRPTQQIKEEGLWLSSKKEIYRPRMADDTPCPY